MSVGLLRRSGDHDARRVPRLSTCDKADRRIQARLSNEVGEPIIAHRSQLDASIASNRISGEECVMTVVSELREVLLGRARSTSHVLSTSEARHAAGG